jgi:hypothetical protein
MSVKKEKSIDAAETVQLLETLSTRFCDHPHRHPRLKWSKVESALVSNPAKLASVWEMERTGGQPDVVGFERSSGLFLFMDCSPESPAGRRSLCYDEPALRSRKEHPPQGSAVGMAQAMGIALLTEEQYRHLQSLGPMDRKTSSWLQTPTDVRDLGGALFGDFRYGRTFTYHNGADSYYGVRGFRGVLAVG